MSQEIPRQHIGTFGCPICKIMQACNFSALKHIHLKYVVRRYSTSHFSYYPISGPYWSLKQPVPSWASEPWITKRVGKTNAETTSKVNTHNRRMPNSIQQPTTAKRLSFRLHLQEVSCKTSQVRWTLAETSLASPMPHGLLRLTLVSSGPQAFFYICRGGNSHIYIYIYMLGAKTIE